MTSKNALRLGGFLFVGLGLLGLGVAGGCGSVSASFCEAQRECENLNDSDEEACKAAADATQDIASIYGCSDQYDSVVECVDGNATCEGFGDQKVYTTLDVESCINGDLADCDDRCASQRKNLKDCIDGASAADD